MCDDIRPGYCKYHVGRHLIFYCQFPEGLEIVRILYDRMDVETYFNNGEYTLLNSDNAGVIAFNPIASDFGFDLPLTKPNGDRSLQKPPRRTAIALAP